MGTTIIELKASLKFPAIPSRKIENHFDNCVLITNKVLKSKSKTVRVVIHRTID